MDSTLKLDSLEERLKSHAEAFNGLLSLIPAKVYYGEDTSDQWQRKKQTKEQRQAARRAKLDPDNAKSAKDVLDEQVASAKKRKREEDGEGSNTDVEGVTREEPLSSTVKQGKQIKKQNRDNKDNQSIPADPGQQHVTKTDSGVNAKDESAHEASKAAKTREKKARKKAKIEKKMAKAEVKKARKQQEAALTEDLQAAEVEAQPDARPDTEAGQEIEAEAQHMREDISDSGSLQAQAMDSVFIDDGLVTVPSPSTSPSPTNQSSTFDNSNQNSGSSSISSIAPTSIVRPEGSKHDTGESLSQAAMSNSADNKARFQARIEQLRAARKADGSSATPARSRQELLESRRRKEEERRLHKKELRRKAKEEEQRKREETLARGSPLLSGSPLHSPGSPALTSAPNNFAFGRMAFPNGQRVSDSLNAILEPRSKPKGPSDPHTALQAAQKKEARIASLDPVKQADVVEKETWLNAKKRAHGERIRDDTSLLKKTLKRKDKQKKKSEKEWKERIEGVQKGQAMKQKKREMNIQKRKDEKGQKKGGKGSTGSKRKARPGFEGSFRAKAPRAAGEEKPRRR